MRGNAGPTQGTVNQQNRHDQDDDGPPNPGATGTVPRGHYAEDEQDDEDPRPELGDLLEMMRSTISDNSGLAGVQTSIDLLRDHAQRLLSLLAAAGRRVEDAEGRERISQIVEVVGEGLLVANDQNAAAVSLADYTQRFFTTTVSLAEYADYIANSVALTDPRTRQ
jgi:hypothetical protein